MDSEKPEFIREYFPDEVLFLDVSNKEEQLKAFKVLANELGYDIEE